MSNQLAGLYLALGDLVEPLRRRLDSLEALEFLAYRYGWIGPLNQEGFERIGQGLTVIAPLNQLLETTATLRQRLESDPGASLSPEDIARLIEQSSTLLRALAVLQPSALDGLVEPYGRAEFWESLAEHLVDDLLEEYLRVYHPGFYAVLRLWGAIRYEPVRPAEPFRRPYTRTLLDWDQVLAMVRDPRGALQSAYRWGDTERGFDHQGALTALADALRAARVPSAVITPAIEQQQPFLPEPGRDIERDVAALRAVLWQGASAQDQTVYRTGFELYPAARTTDTVPTGLMIRPLLQGAAGATLPLGQRLALRWSVAASAGEAIGFALFPDTTDFIGGEPVVGTRLELRSTGEGPWYLVGNAGSSHIQLADVSAALALSGTLSDPELELSLAAGGGTEQPGCRVVVNLADSDQFVGKLVNRPAVDLALSPRIVWSSKHGLSFEGMPALDVRVPVNIALGPITVTNLGIAVGEAPGNGRSGLACRVGLGLNGKLGPLELMVEQIGFACTVTRHTQEELRQLPPGEATALGGLGVDLAFAPPRGIGLLVDAKVIVGGGYLEAYPERGEYLGFAQLTLKDQIAIKAYGVILTRPQVSFLLLISAEFPPIQLGLGFRLTGVGGIVGINRRLDTQRLLDGLRDNLLDELLFPADPSRDPHSLVTKAAGLFPASEGQYAFGPSALITWGPSDLVRIKLALVIELPAFRISVLGVLQALVSKRVAGRELLVLELQVNFAGVFDFEECFIRFDASLYRSRLLGLTLDGEMAWRLRYGSGSPDLVMTLGGFHPDFQPPALALPANIRRLQITLASGNPHIWVDAYFAITSNSIQFGAGGHLRFSKWGVGISGDLGFDALFQFSPFHFEAGVFFLLSASWKGVDFTSIEITGTFSGPSPWRIKGQFKLKICWFLKITVPIDESWGDSDETSLGQVDVIPLLLEDLGSARTWERTTGQTHLLVSCRPSQVAPEELLVHPNDLLAVRQSTVPLGLKIDKFGERRPRDASRFRIALKRGGGTMSGVPLRAHFAPAQFFHRTDEQRLSASSYELFEAGAGFEDLDAVVFDGWAVQDVAYETGYVDEAGLEPPEPEPPRPEPGDRFHFGLLNNAVANSVLGRVAGPRRNGRPGPMAEEYVVADTGSLAGGERIVAHSEAEARELLREVVERDPGRRLDFEILPLSDLGR